MFRFAILTAVSTDIQAREEKASLGDQEKTARAAGIQQGGVESVGPFILDGYSRTGYVNLSDAMQDIPPLAAALESVMRDEYDVLVVDNIERLGDLAPMVSTFFKKYRKQIHSARQPSRIFDPDEYDPFSDEGSDIMIHVEGIIQKYRINKLQRGKRIGMPRRIEQGLNPLRIPFGYKWVSKKDPPSQVPTLLALVQQMKDMLFQGRSLTAIAAHADASGILSPNGGTKWDLSTIKYILSNPFYAGIVTFNKSKYVYDATRKRKKRMIPQPRSRWKEGQGKHEPLWDDATHRAILRELERRRKANQNFAARFPLSGLLWCSECKRKIHRRTHGFGYGRRKVFSCAAAPSHVIIPYDEGLDLVAHEITRQLADYAQHPKDIPEDIDTSQAALAQLERDRRRIQDGYKKGIFSDAEAMEEMAKIETQKESIQQQSLRRLNAIDLRSEFLDKFRDNLDQLPEWIKTDDPQIVHQLLAAMCEQIILHPDRRVEIVWRE